jgi:hypothetical protein
MATTTTNFGWDIPQSTDLVKDGATAIAALGQDIDTAFIDLKGGTTGQVLAKASGTDLDFSWIAADDTNAIQNAIMDAKGDLIGATAADTPARLAVGANGTVLTADSTAATGLAWATPAAASGPAFRAFRNTSNQTVTADVFTKVQLNAETFDTDSCFDSTTNYRFTPTKAGYYQINCGVLCNIGDSEGTWVWLIYKNGSSVTQGEGTSGSLGRETGSGSDLIYFNGSSDYVELYGYCGSGPSTSFGFGSAKTYFSGTWIRS